jgi:hypothetical protein
MHKVKRNRKNPVFTIIVEQLVLKEQIERNEVDSFISLLQKKNK